MSDVIKYDFPKAFTAYERGATIKAEVTGLTFNKNTPTMLDFPNVFTVDEIRGKWIVEGDGEYWWE